MDTIVNIEVFMQRPNQPAQIHPGQSREELPLGGIQAHHTLESRQALYQLSYHWQLSWYYNARHHSW